MLVVRWKPTLGLTLAAAVAATVATWPGNKAAVAGELRPRCVAAAVPQRVVAASEVAEVAEAAPQVLTLLVSWYPGWVAFEHCSASIQPL